MDGELPSTGGALHQPRSSIITPGHLGDSTYTAPVFEFDAAGLYTVSLLVENSCGVSIKDTTVLVCELPDVSFAEMIFTSADLVISRRSPYNYNCDSTIVSYSWHISPNTYSFTGATTATSKYPEINFTDFTDYRVKLFSYKQLRC